MNIVAIITYLWLCIQAIKLISRHIGKATSVAFVILGLLSFGGKSGKIKDKNQEVKKLGMFSPDSLNLASVRMFSAELDDNLISHTDLLVNYGRSENGEFLPIDAFSVRNGLVAGIVWQPETIIVRKSLDSLNFNYTVTGTLEWKLLSATLYTQPKTYSNSP